ncbi:MAG TPA: PEGA domain-containing protein, partial [Polyangiaceae bacterium]|nr:PEGA domain-containing protein [Polyangiaceae bacterium]
FVIDMTASSAPPAPAPEPEPAPGPAPKAGGHTAPAPKTAPHAAEPKATASGNGTLNLNSIPVSNVILDGRPLGPTPKSGVSVAAGPHTVIFVHPEHGRKAKTVTVEAGKSAAAFVKFP